MVHGWAGLPWDHNPGHANHAKHPPIPDWRKYKVADCNLLSRIEREFTAQGLKDPWLRNEVWRHPSWHNHKPVKRQFWVHCGRGMKWGFLAALITTAIHYSVDFAYVPRLNDPDIGKRMLHAHHH